MAFVTTRNQKGTGNLLILTQSHTTARDARALSNEQRNPTSWPLSHSRSLNASTSARIGRFWSRLPARLTARPVGPKAKCFLVLNFLLGVFNESRVWHTQVGPERMAMDSWKFSCGDRRAVTSEPLAKIEGV